MLLENATAERVDFHLPNRLAYAGSFKTELEAADASE